MTVLTADAKASTKGIVLSITDPIAWNDALTMCFKLSMFSAMLLPVTDSDNLSKEFSISARPLEAVFFKLVKEVAIPTLFCLARSRSEEHTSELQSRGHLVCRLL